MMRVAAVLAGMCLLLGGCLQSKTVVTVNKDGSGTIEQTAYWAEMDMEQGPDGQPQPKQKNKPLDLEALKKQVTEYAPKLGEGVTLKSLDGLKHEDGRNGAKVVYDFKDVSKLAVPMIPKLAPMMQATDGKDDEPVKFAFEKQGGGGKLTVDGPPMKAQGKDEEKPANPQEEAMQDAMLGQLFKGTVIDFVVQVNGEITKTDAANKDKNTVTMIHADLDALAKDPEAVKAFKGTQKIKDQEAMGKALTTAPLSKFFKVETKDKVVIEFK